MTVPVDTIEAIAAWLASQFPQGTPSAIADSDRDLIVFRVRATDGRLLGEVEISDEALQDLPAQSIISDFARSDLVSRMQVDPRFRRSYTKAQALSDSELRSVAFEGRIYTVVRDRQHNVRILDDRGVVLEESPGGPLVLPNSIFSRNLASWQQDIRQWRGESQ